MRIERLVPCPPEDLWRALIQNTELGEQGAMLRLALPGGLSETAGKITVYESPRVLECAWGADVLRWELQPQGCHTRLVFTHAECAAHWMAHLEGIEALATRTAEAAVGE
jgi:hypothetical protein